jgi:AmiR/NasT family two-component response regulator
VFVSRAAITLAHAEQVANLRRALGSRQTIGEAVGILMERHRFTTDLAFARLVSASQHGQIKLRDLAAQLTETAKNQTPRSRSTLTRAPSWATPRA